MSEFNPDPDLEDVPDAVARFVLALVASLALHLVLAFGVQIKAAQPVARGPVAMEVRVERAPQARIKALLTASVADTVEEKPVEPTPEEEKPEPPPPAPEEPKPSEGNPELQPLAPAEAASAILPTLDIPLLEDPTWYPAKQVDVHPVALQPIKPDYPDKAVDRAVEGSVILLLLIDEAGAVKDINVVEANPEGLFEESALAAFREARFAPAQKNGRAVKSRVLIRVSYELNDRKKPQLLQAPLPLMP